MADAIPMPYALGKLSGVNYEFQKANDILSAHYHGKDQGHILIVQSGCVSIKSVYLDENWEKIAKQGEVCDLPDEQWHEIIALEDNTKILNINK